MAMNSVSQMEALGIGTKDRTKYFFWFWSGGFLFFGLVLIGLLYALFYADFLRVKSIEMKGTRFPATETFKSRMIAMALGDNYPLSILGPDNIFFWYFGREPRILSAMLPAVVGVNKNVSLLKSQVELVVTERESQGIWCPNADSCFSFDRDGVVFAAVPRAEGVLVLRIDDQNEQPVILGRSVLPQVEWFDNLVKTVKIMRENGFQVTTVRIRDFSLAEWEAVTGGPVFYFSFRFVPDNIVSVLSSLNVRFKGSKLNYLDFRVPNRIYYK